MSEALNVTKAAFGGLREVTTAPLWQYDYGQILEITGLDLPQAFEGQSQRADTFLAVGHIS